MLNAAKPRPTSHQNVDEADLILFQHLLGARESAKKKVFSDLGRIKHLKARGVKIGVGGCVASQEAPRSSSAAPLCGRGVWPCKPATACPRC